MKNNLIFIGMPAVGKSTVGIVVAKRLGMNITVFLRLMATNL